MVSKLKLIFVLVLIILISVLLIYGFKHKERKYTGTITITPLPQSTNLSLRDARVAVVFEPINAKASDGRNATILLQDMKADFVLRGYFKWGRCLEWYPWVGLPCTYQEQLQSLNELSSLISQLKRERPNLIFGGTITFSHLDPKDTYADGTPIGDDWEQMAFRDKKGNLVKFYGGYVADIASPLWRKYLIGWAEKQIDAGVDSFFFDQHFMAAEKKFFKEQI